MSAPRASAARPSATGAARPEPRTVGKKKRSRRSRPISQPEPTVAPPPSRGSSGGRDEPDAGGEWEYGWRAPSRTTGTGGGPNSTF